MTCAVPIALTIAGSDSSGGAGIQADLKTFSAFGVYGASVLTALTAQNTRGVSAVHVVPPEFVGAQIDAVLDDLDVRAVKVGMAGTAAAIEVIAERLAQRTNAPVVVDPVMVAQSGAVLIDTEAEAALAERLLPLADLLTPNLAEAARLLNLEPAEGEAEMRAQARALFERGPRAVLIKGGHGSGPEAVDMLFDGSEFKRLALRRIETIHGHGTGCTLSSAIAACLAHGASLREAIVRAKGYVNDALRYAHELEVGQGPGPVHHFHALWPREEINDQD